MSSQKRYLTQSEISCIIDSIPPSKALPSEISKSIRRGVVLRLREDLKKVKIYPEIFEKFKAEILHIYWSSQVPAGEAIGMLTAQSIGERQTQNTLNTFHSSGINVKSVSVGVPRFSELLNSTKNPKIVNCLIFLNEDFSNVQELRDRISGNFTDITLKRLTNRTKLIKDGLEDWHILFCDLYGIDKTKLNWRLRFFLNIELLYEYKIHPRCIAKKIKSEYEDAIVMFTPVWDGILDVFIPSVGYQIKPEIIHENEILGEVDSVEEGLLEQPEVASCETEYEDEDITEEGDEITEDINEEDIENVSVTYGNKDKCMSIDHIGIIREDEIPHDILGVEYAEDRVLPALLNLKVCGISNITDIFFEKRDDEWVLTTEGSNLRELFCNPLVNKHKTLCNNMWEIYEIFGIEATRQFLVEEYMDVVGSDGTWVNACHVELLVDIMCNTGNIISISRYGQKKLDIGPLCRSSFEESVDQFLKSGINGLSENTRGVSASIMLGKMAKTGTGAFNIYMDIPRLKMSNVVCEKIEVKEEEDDEDFDIVDKFTSKSFFN